MQNNVISLIPMRVGKHPLFLNKSLLKWDPLAPEIKEPLR